jgi:hypothetical protein
VQLELEAAMAEIEGGYACRVCHSGLAAIETVLMAFTRSGDHILVCDNVYGPTRDFGDRVLSKYGVEVEYLPPAVEGRRAVSQTQHPARLPRVSRIEHLRAPGCPRRCRDRADEEHRRIGKIRQVAASKIGGLPRSMPAEGCWWVAPSVRRIGFEGSEVKGDEVDRSWAMNWHPESAEPMASARQEGSLRGFF